jgi:hypothetical protein
VDKGVDVVMVRTDGVEVVREIANMRMRAYCWVFTDSWEVRRAAVVMFGVYCF